MCRSGIANAQSDKEYCSTIMIKAKSTRMLKIFDTDTSLKSSHLLLVTQLRNK